VSHKTTTAAATCVAAVPALILGYFLVNTFLTGLGHLEKPFMSLYAATLAACAAIVFLPLGVLIFGPRSPKAPKAEQKPSPQADAKDQAEKDEGEKEPEADAEEITESLGKSSDSVEIARPDMGDDETTGTTGEIEVVEDEPVDDTVAVVDEEFADDELDALDEDEEKKPPKKGK
jgi:hypothetical protein